MPVKKAEASDLLSRLNRYRSPLLPIALGGLCMGLTPDPVNAWPLAWMALAPLWRAVLGAEPGTSNWRVFGWGLLWSGIYHGIALSWITALHPLTWMGVPWLGSIAIALFAWSFITGLGAVTFGLWAVALRWLSDRPPLGSGGRIVAGAALWCGLETALSWGPLYWPSLSYTQSPGNLWILHLGQLAGPMAVTAAIVAVNGCWAECLEAATNPATRQIKGDRRRFPASQNRSMATLALTGIILWVSLHGIGLTLYARLLIPDPAAQLQIGLIQGNIPTRIKLTPEGTRQAIRAYTEGYRQLGQQGADAVLTPEGAVPEIWTRTYQARSPLWQAVRQQQVILWLGTFRPTPQNPRQLTQSLITLDAQGQVSSQYNKVKLVPLGEYIPFQAVLGRVISRLSPVSSSLQPGNPHQVFETPWGPAIAGICYESAYSELFRWQAAQGGEWIMTASNNDPYPPRMMRQHHAQDVMRAIESDRWSVRVTNTGISGLVTPHGNTVWLSEPNQYAVYMATLYRRNYQTLYVRWGNWLPIALSLCTLLIGIKASVSPRKRPTAEE